MAPLLLPPDSETKVTAHAHLGEAWAVATVVGTNITVTSERYPYPETDLNVPMREAFETIQAMITPDLGCKRGRNRKERRGR